MEESLMAKKTDNNIWLNSTIAGFIQELSRNNLASEKLEIEWSTRHAWAEPLVGFANGADQIFDDYKEHVGDFHWTPCEIFAREFPDLSFTAEELTVISWVLPQTRLTKEEHSQSKRIPCENWIRSRIFGEKTNEALRRHLVNTLAQAGYPAVAPILTHGFSDMEMSSEWSERHAAYAAGLGTFGLCDGLITPFGKAIRVGSVVAKIDIPPTDRPYSDHRAYCLFFSENACGECIKRCPAGALSKKKLHDKEKCNSYIQNTVAVHTKKNFGFPGRGGCGLCQTGVPCESNIPELADLT
jgi:epoxyqueuosine reductase